MPIVYPDIGDRAVLTAISAMATAYSGCKVQLFAPDIIPDPTSVLADLTAVNFSGYALSAAVTFGTVYQGDDGINRIAGIAKQFTQTAITLTDTAHGWCLVGTPSGTPFLLCSKPFDNPVEFDLVSRGVIILPELSLIEGQDGIVYSAEGILAELTALVDTAAYLDAAELRLYTQASTPNKGTLLASFVEADFTGYNAAAVITWGVPFTTEAGVQQVEGGSIQFTQTATTITNTVYGWYLVGDPGGTEYLICSNQFDQPIEFDLAGRGVVVTPVYALPH